ncbi:MAG TPA: RuBisCO large subunit C-terminal-like domain-containing protein [Desulfitobacteriaceae bacterium]|nr:RuBisCO large subunit C-terminal-like domain-containing protein [Desulfitobacteriaceae bacterium]
MRIKYDDDLLRPQLAGERFSVVYRISGTETAALAVAQDICIEQTIEFPEECVPDGAIRDFIFGRIEKMEKYRESRKENEEPENFKNITAQCLKDSSESNAAESYLVEISYALEICAAEFTQLLNVVFGNISIKPGIRVEKILLSPSLLGLFRGPRFGRAGLRQILQVPQRPLLFSALKPMGLSARELARLAYQFALGGIDIIKDDHGLSDQKFAPFAERVKLCSEAVHRANQKTGRKTIYVPNVTAPARFFLSRAQLAKEYGAGGLLIAPGLVGFDNMKELAEDDSIALPIFSHPAFQGSYVLGDAGISHYALYGQLMRMAGADAVIYPNFGGRFSFNQAECRQIGEGTAAEMGHLKPIFPTPGGGISFKSIPALAEFYGSEVIFLMGGGLFTSGEDLVENCRHFRELVEKTFSAE